MKWPRLSGILLHPTSLPGPAGIGDLGEGAYRFVDFLREGGQQLWQVLPLGHTGYGDSPYQCFSAFAGNPLLISLPKLVDDGLIPRGALDELPATDPHLADYGAAFFHKWRLLESASESFFRNDSHPDRSAFETFCTGEAMWLDDYALFIALKQKHEYAPWTRWDTDIAKRKAAALKKCREELNREIATLKFVQFQFAKQWSALKAYCGSQGIRIMGDAPIYVAHDCADVWSRPDLFQLTPDGEPVVVAGVPPDYFSATGQLWGNPIYRWNRMKKNGFEWWISRMRTLLRTVDIVRIDHFRGFESYWEVPATESTAVNGRWVQGPGDALFEAIREALGDAPIAAENLGVITDEVEALRERQGFPGMAVLQFAFGHDAKHSGLLPHLWTPDTVAYTGTHDNDTITGWWRNTGHNTHDSSYFDQIRAYASRYLNTDGHDIHWVAIRAVMASVANTVIIPLQDVMGLGSEARINLPGSGVGANWRWRYTADMLTSESAWRLRDLTDIYGRLP
ncbi:MAG: 4-alpha-glucanotransferase [Candidatus Hydrogenedentota bacterium]